MLLFSCVRSAHRLFTSLICMFRFFHGVYNVCMHACMYSSVIGDLTSFLKPRVGKHNSSYSNMKGRSKCFRSIFNLQIQAF